MSKRNGFKYDSKTENLMFDEFANGTSKAKICKERNVKSATFDSIIRRLVPSKFQSMLNYETNVSPEKLVLISESNTVLTNEKEKLLKDNERLMTKIKEYDDVIRKLEEEKQDQKKNILKLISTNKRHNEILSLRNKEIEILANFNDNYDGE